MKQNDLIKKIKNFLTKKRLFHTLNVVKISLYLAEKYKVNPKKVFWAAILHDIAKDIKISQQKKILKNLNDNELKEIPLIWHGFTGAIIAKKIFKITDENILNAIKYHSTGNLKMRNIEKIVFVADYIEPGRKYLSSVKIRKKLKMKMELNELVLLVLEEKIKYLIKLKKNIFKNSIDLWNNLSFKTAYK